LTKVIRFSKMYYVMQTLVSTKYQVVIPKEARRKIGLKPGQKMDVEVTENRIVLSKTKGKSGDYYKKLGGLWKSSEDIEKYLEEQDRAWE